MGIKRIGGGMAVNQITEGVIWKQLLYFFFPILFGTFFQQLYNVGQFVGTQALAAVGGATGSLINFFVNLFVGLASGTTVVIAQAYGAHDAESVGGTVHTSVALALAAGQKTVLFFGGLTDQYEGEGYDRESLAMPANQLRLLDKICEINPNVAVVSFSGAPRPMSSPARMALTLDSAMCIAASE